MDLCYAFTRKGGSTVQEWIYAAQKLVNYVEDHICENPSLSEISAHIGYSSYYCSEQFHRVAGMTIREYIQKRRLAMAAVELRDTGVPIVDIALKYGFSDQTTFTRSFKSVYGCAPSAYRKWPKPLPLVCKKMLLEPFKKKEGETDMGNLSKPYVHLEYIPAHKDLGIYKRFVTGEGEIWPGHDCDLGCGIISSFKEEELDLIVTRFTAGWTWENGERSYFFGSGVPTGYRGTVPEGFELRGEFPGSYYIVFGHQPFDYLSENVEVMKRVEELAWNFEPGSLGFAWNEDVCQDYQRHYPEVMGYQVLRPVKKL